MADIVPVDKDANVSARELLARAADDFRHQQEITARDAEAER